MTQPLSVAERYAQQAGITPEELRRMLTPKMTGYIPHKPTAPQTAYLLLQCIEAFYGGAASGGKSDALLMAALQYVDIPNYSALILRKSYSDLAKPGAIMDRAKQWLIGTDAKWNEKDKTFTFPSGARLVFGYLDTVNDVYQYQSAEFQFIGFDELTQFEEFVYTFMFTRLRRLIGATVPLRMRSASNPGGIGHEWVKARFIPNSEDTELKEKELFEKKSRIFIPAFFDDNPHIDREAYERSMENTDPLTRAQMMSGDWEISGEGTKFSKEWFDDKMRDWKDRPQAFDKLIRFWDLAATELSADNKDPDWTAGVLMGRDKDSKDYWILDVRRKRGTPHIIEKFIQETAQDDAEKYGGRGAVDIRFELEPGSASIHLVNSYKKGVLAGYPFRGQRLTGRKDLRANPLSQACQNGDVYIVRGAWNNAFFNELIVFPLKGFHDDQVDAASAAFELIHIKNRFGVGSMKDAKLRRRNNIITREPTPIGIQVTADDILIKSKHRRRR